MEPDFKKGSGLIPAIIQDVNTNKVLMLGFMNEHALAETLKSGKVTFYSRTKKRLWTKGETSGNFLIVKEMLTDCDNDALLIKAQPTGSVCHTGKDTCFGEANKPERAFLYALEKIISERNKNPTTGSYTSHLFEKGINKIAQKLGEEAVELVIEAMDNNKELFLNEAADLIYHFLVLLQCKRVTLTEVENVLQQRHKINSQSFNQFP